MSILIFDSGIGGLSVYNEIKQLMPDVHYIYAFDNEGFPYGGKSKEMIEHRVITFIDKIKPFYGIDIAVIACNTATTACLTALRQRYIFPVVGVVPAIKPAVQISSNGRIGLLATKATLTHIYTAKLIKQFAANYHIECLGLTELAISAEEKLYGKLIDMQKLTSLMCPWLNLSYPLDTIVLGCTHYLFIKEELQFLFPDAVFIDSGHAVAKRTLSLSNNIPSLSHNRRYYSENIAISTVLSNKIRQLIPVLNSYDFTDYKVISLDAV